MAWTPLKVLDWTARRFAEAGIEAARLEAQVLLAHALGCTRVQLYTGFDRPLEESELAGYRGLIKRRLAGESVAYLVGEQEFWSLSFVVDGSVLVPRRDTETVIEVVRDELGDRAASWRVVDACTGSGCIAVTLARELPAAQVWATELSPEAAAIAVRNAERNGVAARVDVRVGDLLEPVAAELPVDVLVANPPYIATDVIAGLPLDVRREPHLALDGGADGLDLLRRLAAAAPAALRPGGLVAFEHGFDQGPAVRALLDATGALTPAVTRPDLGGRPRVTHARRR
ncbi:MAG: peptide chain release factor N(5)-glutamine methyltransferase [Kofleriaceae bacterium]|nr:peptide chain release factor N(5)-glutamine methyltransferase [Kofleriaceae bacterium]MCB9575236.1 peptide chain release factor N(5)-glutamine methyltransferase [Kofleriaceae bacterium]